MKETKSCKICSIEKPLSEFIKSALSFDGTLNMCKKCRCKQVADAAKKKKDERNYYAQFGIM